MCFKYGVIPCTLQPKLVKATLMFCSACMHAEKVVLVGVCYLGARGSLLHYCSYVPSNVHSYNLEPTANMFSLFACIVAMYCS